MKAKYLVKEMTKGRYLDGNSLPQNRWALQLKTRYGLYMYSVPEVFQTWMNFSKDKYQVNWLCPCKSTVEQAFGVRLVDVDK